jgi:integrase
MTDSLTFNNFLDHFPLHTKTDSLYYIYKLLKYNKSEMMKMNGGRKKMKIIDDRQMKNVRYHIEKNNRNPKRDLLLFNLSLRQGLRSIEMSNLKWSNVLEVKDGLIEWKKVMNIHNTQTKGNYGGRDIPIHKDTLETLKNYFEYLHEKKKIGKDIQVKDLYEKYILVSQRNNKMSNLSITNFFHNLYQSMGMIGYGSHSGRRTFITNCSKMISQYGGSLKEVQELSGHSNIQTTQGYIDTSEDSKMKLIMNM